MGDYGWDEREGAVYPVGWVGYRGDAEECADQCGYVLYRTQQVYGVPGFS